MEADKNFFPEITLNVIDGARSIGRKVLSFVNLPESGYRGEHFRGASEMLDAALCPDEVPAPDQQAFGWDDQGRYINELGEAL